MTGNEYQELAGTTHPLTWTELTSVGMIGQPVWNSYTRKWMLIIDSDNLKAWVDLANHSGGTERWIEHDAQKYPLYRTKVMRLDDYELEQPDIEKSLIQTTKEEERNESTKVGRITRNGR